MSSLGRRYYPLSLLLVEDVEEYRPGGFHPVHVGDVFQERFKVLHKLGSGGFSTTWLARDDMDRRYVALKILKAEETASDSELRMLQSIARITGDHPGRHHIRLPLHDFLIEGPNGCHKCLVTDIAGPSLYELYNVPGMGYAAGARRLRADLAHKVNAQVVEAVEFLHCNGIVHGDLTLPNLLLKVKSIDHWTEEEVYRQLGDPVKEKVRTISKAEPGLSAPRYVVGSAGIPHTDFLASDIYLVDFGESFRIDEAPRIENIGIPFMYRAPESIFMPQYDQHSEIWALACLLFGTRAGDSLFVSVMGGADEVIQQMVQIKGKLPEAWWQRWEKRKLCFDDDGKPLKNWPGGKVLAVQYPLEEMIGDIGSEDDDTAVSSGPAAEMLEPSWTKVPADEAVAMKDLLDGMLKWVPSERLSIQEVRKHSWISRYKGNYARSPDM